MRGGYRPGAGRKPLSIKERQAKREARNAARRTTLRENPPHRDPRSWAEKVPEGFKRGLSNQAMRALIALGNAPAVMNRDRPEFNPFKLPDFPPSVVPKDTKLRLAMDDALCETQNWASTQWAGFQWAGLASEGLVFPGYAYLSNLAIRPEYRIASETIADEMTRKWIKFRGVGENPGEKDDDDEEDDLDAMDREIQNDLKKGAKKGQGEVKSGGAKTADKSERIKELVDFMDHLGVKDAYYNAEMGGGLFGRMHLFHEIAQNDGQTPQGLEELKTPLGDGRGSVSKSKVGPQSPLTGIRAVEPTWTYPTTYNTLNPLSRDWYNPQVWYTQGQQIHVDRLFRLVPRPVPDLLKPSFSFGGLSLTQMMTPYVDIWLQTRAAIARLIQSFSCMVLSTDLQATLQDPNMGAAVLMARVQAANATRGNQGLWVLNKATETLENVSASLAGLHELQAQAQEHLLSVTRIPAVKYTGIQPTGLNASSEGEIKVFEDTIVGMQERNFRGHLTRTVRFCMLSLWGEVDEDIVFDFVPLRELTEKEQAEVQKLKAETWDLLMNGTQSIGPTDVRKQLAADPDSGFDDIDPEEEPDIPEPVNPESGGKIDLKGNAGFGGGPDASKEGGAEDQNPFGLDEWNEGDHPRGQPGNAGQFGPGGGGSETGEASGFASGPISDEIVRQYATKVAKDLGFDMAKVAVSNETKTFVLNGQIMHYAGSCTLASGDVTLYTPHLNEASVRGVIAHEVEHAKFQSALDAYAAESKAVEKDPGPPPNPEGQYWWQKRGGIDAMMTPDGTLREPYDKKYPVYQAMQKTLWSPGSFELGKSDGVSDYSFEYWKGFKAGTVSFNLAVHETLAEIARIKYETGKFPEHMGERILSYRGEDVPKPTKATVDAGAKMWRDLFRVVDDVWKRQPRNAP